MNTNYKMPIHDIDRLSPFAAPSEPCDLIKDGKRVGFLEHNWVGDWCLWDVSPSVNDRPIVRFSGWLEMLAYLCQL